MSASAMRVVRPLEGVGTTPVEGASDAEYRSSSARETSASMGKYRAFFELGQGGTAVVFLGVSRGLGGFNKLVVLKMLKRGLAKESEFRRMFLSEARLSARLNHPNIVQVYEVTERDNSPIIVMEYLEGKPLSEMRAERNGAIPVNIQLRVLADGLLGLHYSHDLKDFDGRSLDLVHRDFTPHNLFVTYDGQAKVLDFGIAKLSGSLVETETGVIKGKLRYMPPEQVLGNRVDRRADIFAAGVIMWEAITGKRMWADASEATIVNRISRGEIPSPLSANPDVPQALSDICMKALAPNVDDRYATAADLRGALDEWLRLSGGSVFSIDVAEYMTNTFADFRQATRSVIEQHLSAARLSSSHEESEAHSLEPPTGTLEASPVTAEPSLSVSRSASRQTLMATTSSRRTIWLASIGLLLFGLAAYLFFGRVKPVPVSAPVATQVAFIIAASPPTATLTLDGELLPGNPYSGHFPRDDKRHALVIEAAGHASQTLQLTFSEDRTVALTLSPLPPPPSTASASRREDEERPAASTRTSAHAGRRPSGAGSRPVALTPQPSAKVRPNCTPPYTIDSNGFKVYKTGCL
jgi:eukaryotic-like serine/threonine-protein kinase